MILRVGRSKSRGRRGEDMWMAGRQLHKPFSYAYIKQQIAQCSRKVTSTKLCPRGDAKLQAEPKYEINTPNTGFTCKWKSEMNSRSISIFCGFISPNLNSHLVSRPIKGLYSNMEKVDYVRLKLSHSFKNPVQF